MGLTIDLDPTEQSRLASAARRAGKAPSELARELLLRHLPLVDQEGTVAEPTLALLDEWDKEGVALSPEEAAEEAELWRKFEAGVNATRRALGMRQL